MSGWGAGFPGAPGGRGGEPEPDGVVADEAAEGGPSTGQDDATSDGHG